jgi:hypothetical protein
MFQQTEDSWVYDNDMDCPDKLNFYWIKHPNKERDYKKRKASEFPEGKPKGLQ